MRRPQEDLLPKNPRLRVLALDITEQASIDHAIKEAGALDVLVNNAGLGLMNGTEATSLENIREVFATNTLGTIAMTKAVLPQFTSRRSGVIVNVSSSVTLKTLPLLAAYSASKAAVNAFSQSLALELEPSGVRVRIVLPGASPTTDFGKNARKRMGGDIPPPYAAMREQMFAAAQKANLFTQPKDVAEAIWLAATDPSSPLRIPAGSDAKALAE